MRMMMMLRRPMALKSIAGHDDEEEDEDDYDYGNNVEDSGAETAESDCSKMSSPTIEEPLCRRRQQQQQSMLMMQTMVMNMHLLANPGDSLLLQQTLDSLLRWLCPSLRIFHVSERAAPLRAAAPPSYARASSSSSPRHCPATGYPSLAVTFFLHEAYGEQRILRVLDFLQRPPWQYHHTESGGAITGAGGVVHISSCSSPGDALLRPYLLPSRDYYRLGGAGGAGGGMPLWAVRPVHCGGEVLRVTLHSAHRNYRDTVHLYETVLQRRAQEGKAGFCWFTLHTEPGLSLQLAVKRLSPGVEVEPCSSAVLQFRVEEMEMGQLVPLLPNPCSPISASRWQTEDLDGNKILFQVKTSALQPPRPLTCAAFPPTCPGRGHAPTTPLSWTGHAPPCRPAHRPRTDPGLEKPCSAGGSPTPAAGVLDGRCSSSSTPPGSSCYSSQRSSPCPPAPPPNPPRDSPLRRSLSHSLSHLLLEEEEEEEEPETNVDTGAPVSPRYTSSSSHAADATAFSARRRPASPSMDLSLRPRWPEEEEEEEERPAAVGEASALESMARELIQCLPDATKRLAQPPPLAGASRTLRIKAVSSSATEGRGNRTVAAARKAASSPAMEGRGASRTVAAGRSPSKEAPPERTLGGTAAAEPASGGPGTTPSTLSARDKHGDELDEFFI